MSSLRSRVEDICWMAGGLIATCYAIIPLIWIISLSLKKGADLSDHRFLPSEFTFENYSAIFRDIQFPAALLNSLAIALIATALTVLFATFAAYAIVRLRFPGKSIVLGSALATAMFPPISIIGPLFNI